jgi:peptidoglycan/LPS O-acetylase OafA/YrhL
VLAVFLFHYYNIRGMVIDNDLCHGLAQVFRGAGYLGVDFFFTLSGFLITSILLAQPGFDLGRFYLRRGLRIVPLYMSVVLISYVLMPYVLEQHLHLPPLGYILSFTANHFYALQGDSYLFAITILWSISVEMQFYLLWGAVLRFFSKYLYVLAGIFIVVSVVIKYYLAGKCSLYYISETYVPDFMIGAIGAKLLSDKTVNLGRIPKVAKGVVYLAATGVFIFTPILNSYLIWKILGNCVCALLAAFIIADQSSDGSLLEPGKGKLVSHLGKVSYGIYCFQGFILPAYTRVLLPHLSNAGSVVNAVVVPVVLFAITSVTASISFRYFESYFLRKCMD